jgi:hypothetical protein
VTGNAKLPSSSSERTRRWRRRKVDGTVRVVLQISSDGVNALAALGWLAAEQGHGPQAVGQALLGIARAAVALGVHAEQFIQPDADC